MSSLTNHPERCTAIRCCAFAVAVLLAASPSPAEHSNSAQVGETSGLREHFAAAQEAQNSTDYGMAEREYKAVIAIKPGFAEVHMNLGLVFQLQGRISEAMAEFRLALKLNPTLTGANFFLGVDHCNLGEGRQAIPFLQAAIRQEPKRPDIRPWLATAEEMVGDIQAEVATLKQALSLRPEDVDLLYLLGHAYERLGKAEVTNLQKAAPGSARAEELLAESYAAGSEWPTSVLHYQNALSASPDMPGLHVELGEVLLQAAKLKRAAWEFDEELRLHPRSLRATVRRGEIDLIQGNVESSLQAWQRAVEIDEPQTERILGIQERGLGDAAFEQLPDALRNKVTRLAPELKLRDTPAAHLALSFMAAQNGDVSAARKEAAQAEPLTGKVPSVRVCSATHVREALNHGDFSGVSHCSLQVLGSRSPTQFRINVASALFESGDYDDSLKALSGLTPADRHTPEASYWTARCYEKLAAEAYVSISVNGPNSYRLHQLMGDLEAAKGNDGKAIEEYRIAITLKPSLPNLHYSLGHVFWKDTKIPAAREAFEAELKLNPRHSGALNELGDTYLLEHQPSKALPYLTLALKGEPNNPDIHRDLGTAYSELHDYTEAEAQFKIAVSDDKEGSVHYKLARVYQALGEKERAAHEFEVSTTLNRESHSKLEKQTERLTEVEKSTEEVPANESSVGRLGNVDGDGPSRAERSAQFDLALTDLAAGKYESAVGHARTCIDRVSAAGSKANLAEAWSLVGIAQAHLSEPDNAVNALREAATLAPKQEEHWLNLTRELMELSRYSDAVLAVQEGIAANPRSYVLQLRLGAANMAAGRYPEAEAAFQTLVVAGDPLPTSYVGLAQVLLRTGKAEEAVSELTVAQQKLGATFLVSYFLGLALDRAGRRSEAVSAFQEAVQLNPNSSETHLGLGRTMLFLGQVKEATAELNAALRLNPQDLQARRLLSQAYRRAGDTASAASFADESSEASPPLEVNSLGDFIVPQWPVTPEDKKD